MSPRNGVFPVLRPNGFFRALRSAMLACSAAPAAFAGGPESALVVVNADSWASAYIANEYITARRIPQTNVIRLRDIPDFERMNVEDFREKILTPVLRAAEQRGLAPQIDYVLYSADFPWAIEVSKDLEGKPMPQIITQPAAINGLTYLYQFTMAKNVGYLGLNSNFYTRNPIQSAPDTSWTDDDRKLYADTVTALRTKRAGPADAPDRNLPPPPKLTTELPDKDDSLNPILRTLLDLRKRHPSSTELLYNLACAHARLAQPDEAINALRDAVDNGWWDMGLAARDPDLASVRTREDFAESSPPAQSQ